MKTDTRELRIIMAERGVKTIAELAEISDLDRKTVAKVLNGDTQPSAKVMYGLVGALQIEPERAGNIFFNLNLLNT